MTLTRDLIIMIAAGLFFITAVPIYLLSKPRSGKYRTNVWLAWTFIAMIVVLVLFSLFPQSTAEGQVMAFTISGAFAAFILLLLFGRWLVISVINQDASENALRQQKDEVEAQLRQQKEAAAALERSLREEVSRKDAQIAGLNERAEQFERTLAAKQKDRKELKPRNAAVYRLTKRRGRKIILRTGRLSAVNGVDVWVNSENTNLQMATFFDRSISGAIRYLGAIKDNNGHVIKNGDVIAKDLIGQKGNDFYVAAATVKVTEPGQLKARNGVQKIIHVAAVHGEANVGYKQVDLSNIRNCVCGAMEAADASQEAPLKSILFPLLGTGQAGGDVRKTFETMVDALDSYFEDHPESRIEDVYFILLFEDQLETCKLVLSDLDFVKAEPQGNTAPEQQPAAGV